MEMTAKLRRKGKNGKKIDKKDDPTTFLLQPFVNEKFGKSQKNGVGLILRINNCWR